MPVNLRDFQIFVKPAGARCNLNCGYCYYLKNKCLYTPGKKGVMPDEVLERYIVQNIEASTDDTVNFSWHGGEPLLAGTPFFKKVVELQQKHLPAGRKIINGIQTNGTLINDAWCKFLKNNNFIVGISIDGPGHLHDLYRTKADGSGTFSAVMKGYELLQKYNIPTEILCVVSSGNEGHPLDVYHFFRKLGAGFLTFLPLVNRDMDSGTGVSSDSVSPAGFGRFMGEVFDEWVDNDIGIVKIQLFEEMIRPAFRQEHTLCIFREKCGGVPVVERNGDFYSCDHYVDNDHLVGNIKDGSIAGFLDGERQQAFGEAKYNTLPQFCRNCEVRPMCNGECPKNRFIKTPGGEDGLNYLCEGYRYFFNHTLPFINAVADMWNTPGPTAPDSSR